MRRSTYGLLARRDPADGLIGCFLVAWVIGALLSLTVVVLVIFGLVEGIQWLRRN